jgi:hypothetical protein
MKTFERQGLATPYSFNLVDDLDRILISKGRRKIFFAVDKEGESILHYT